eukprot:31026-Pelagococcus_subviridis.AAC.2
MRSATTGSAAWNRSLIVAYPPYPRMSAMSASWSDLQHDECARKPSSATGFSHIRHRMYPGVVVA